MTYNDLINSAGTVLIEFYATWCPHCRRMMPIVDQIGELLDDQAEVVKLDVDQNQEAATEQKVDATPTFIIYKNGVEQWRQSGEMDGNFLLAKVQSFI